MTEAPVRSNGWKQRHMRSFRVGAHLHEMIRLECKRRNTNFSSFIRNAALGALRKNKREAQLSELVDLTPLDVVPGRDVLKDKPGISPERQELIRIQHENKA
jgi:hypothetical protein